MYFKVIAGNLFNPSLARESFTTADENESGERGKAEDEEDKNLFAGEKKLFLNQGF